MKCFTRLIDRKHVTNQRAVSWNNRIIELAQNGNSAWSVTKDVYFYQSAVTRVWSKYKTKMKVVKGKPTGRSMKTLKHQDRKFKGRGNEQKWGSVFLFVTKLLRNQLKDNFECRKRKPKEKKATKLLPFQLLPDWGWNSGILKQTSVDIALVNVGFSLCSWCRPCLLPSLDVITDWHAVLTALKFRTNFLNSSKRHCCS